MTNQPNTKAKDPVERKNASSLFDAAWRDAQNPLRATGIPRVPKLESPPGFEKFTDWLQYLDPSSETPQETQQLSGEFHLGGPAEPAQIDLNAAHQRVLRELNPDKPFARETMGKAPAVPDFSKNQFRGLEPPSQPLISPEEVRQREQQRLAGISSAMQELRKVADQTGSELMELPVQLLGTTAKQLRILAGVAPSKEERKAAREIQVRNATGEGGGMAQIASEHLSRTMYKKASESRAQESEWTRVAEQEEHAKAVQKAEQPDLGEDLLEQTGSKPKKNALFMFGAASKKAARFGKRLLQSGVNYVKQALLQRWLGKDQASGSTRVG